MFLLLIELPFITIISANILLIYLSLNQNNMKSVIGKVMECGLDKKSYPTKQPKSEGPAYINTYIVKIKYTYMVNGMSFSSKRVNYCLFDVQYPDEKSAQQTIDGIIEGDNVKVYYNTMFPFMPIVQKHEPQIGMNILIIFLSMIVVAGVPILARQL